MHQSPSAYSMLWIRLGSG